MAYQATREAVFDAAARCVRNAVPIVATGRLMTEEDAQRAFDEWRETGGSQLVTMRLTKTADGDVAAEFTPPGLPPRDAGTRPWWQFWRRDRPS